MLQAFDGVCCFNGFQNSFESREKAVMFLQNVAALLKPGGFFFGLLPDSSAIWYKAQRVSNEKPFIKGDLYSIEFESENFDFFGTKYNMKIEEAGLLVEQTDEFLVHFPSLIRLANDTGLKMLEITNLQEFYEDYRKNHSDLLKSMNVLNKQGKIDPAQKDVFGLFTTFLFQKT